MMGKDFVRGIGRLSRFRLTDDLLVLPRHSPVAYELASSSLDNCPSSTTFSGR